jgi:hypothetical protein
MAQLMDTIMQALQGGAHQEIANQAGAPAAQTQSAIAAAVPMILAGLAHKSADPQQAQAIDGALARDHDGGILQDLTGFLRGPQAQAEGGAILGHVLGDRQPVAQEAVARTSGLDPQQAGRILALVAPIVMGALGRAKRQDGLDAGGVAGMLGNERANLQQSSPDLMSMASQLLGGRGGSLANQLGGIAGGLFGKP